MRFFSKNKPSIKDLRLTDFDTNDYKCVGLYSTFKEKPYALLERREYGFMPYRVVGNLFCAVFRSFNDAEKYCSERFIKQI